MNVRRLYLLLLHAAMWTTGILHGQGTEPKAKPEDYPIHVVADSLIIAAENMGHAVNAPERSLVAGDFIVVEVAL